MRIGILALLLLSSVANAENWVFIYKQSGFKYRTFIDKDTVDPSQFPVVSYTAKYEQQPLLFGDSLYFVTQGKLQKFYIIKKQINCQINLVKSVAVWSGNKTQDYIREDKPFVAIQKDSSAAKEASYVCNTVGVRS